MISLQLLDRVYVELDPSTEGFEIVKIMPCARLVYNQPGITYALVTLPEDPLQAVSCSFSATLKFVVKDCDPNTFEPDSDEGTQFSSDNFQDFENFDSNL